MWFFRFNIVNYLASRCVLITSRRVSSHFRRFSPRTRNTVLSRVPASIIARSWTAPIRFSHRIWPGASRRKSAIGIWGDSEFQSIPELTDLTCKFFRLRLADILVRPMQRLTKYSLLLTAIRKHISDENTSEIMDEMVMYWDDDKYSHPHFKFIHFQFP